MMVVMVDIVAVQQLLLVGLHGATIHVVIVVIVEVEMRHWTMSVLVCVVAIDEMLGAALDFEAAPTVDIRGALCIQV